ncbi:MAG TPA: cysteine desulfurase family protein [Acidimicrobiales bacterium]|nr:cysteine desulfurase family protein [Acidimicrobiales bacterium]
MPAYLDFAASTPMRPEAVEAMLPFLQDRFANPSGAHAAARDARRAVDEARDIVAECLGGQPGEVVFTSGGTEADNHAVLGAVRLHGGRAVASAVEHHAVLHPVEHLGGRLVGVDAAGRIDLAALAEALGPDVSVVSVMLANNEVGTVQPFEAVAETVRARAPQAILHTDAVQGFPWLDLATVAAPAACVSVSAHKFGGPKGVGALLVRVGTTLEPLLLGGGQERDRRSGTHNVAGIVAMAAAMRATVDERPATIERVGALRDRLVDGLVAALPDVHETVPRAAKVPGSAHVCIDGVESEALLFLLERGGVYASVASSCASGAMEPSHVLAAMGVAKERAAGALRLSLGYASTAADVDLALDVIPDAVRRLRR